MHTAFSEEHEEEEDEDEECDGGGRDDDVVVPEALHCVQNGRTGSSHHVNWAKEVKIVNIVSLYVYFQYLCMVY